MGDHHHLTLLKQGRGELIPNGALCMRVDHTKEETKSGQETV